MFKFIDRKQKKHLVLIPGWAFDYQIFAGMDLPCNYIFFYGDCMEDFTDELIKFLDENNIDKISLFGFSCGAFAACDFAERQGQMTEEIILVGAREKYEEENLQNIKKYLKRKSKAYLKKFYRDCFSEEEKESYLWFKDTLLTDYLERFSAESLCKSLTWLSQARIEPAKLGKIKQTKIVHGKADAIAPFNCAAALANKLANAELIAFEQTGHLPFLSDAFRERLYE